jgi:hypothetical protein
MTVIGPSVVQRSDARKGKRNLMKSEVGSERRENIEIVKFQNARGKNATVQQSKIHQ